MIASTAATEVSTGNEAYLRLRAAIERELGPDWRTPLPPKPTPRQELSAWMADADQLAAAARRAEIRVLRARLDELERGQA